MSVTSHSGQPIWLRVIRFPLVRLVVLGAALFYMMMWNNNFMSVYADRPLVAIAITIGMGLAALAVYIGYGRLVEGREVTELSTQGMFKEWSTGALIGAALIVSCILILAVLGMYRVEGLNPISFMLPAVAMAISAGIFEELVFRGVLLKSVEDFAGSWIALLVSSLVFGLTHLLNPNGTLVGAVYISIEAGLLLGGAFLLTRRLWLAMGVHMLWNYLQSAVFASVVSGGDSDPGLFKSVFEGPDLLTGGGFGVESSIFALILCTVTGIVMVAMAYRRGHMLPPSWSRN